MARQLFESPGATLALERVALPGGSERLRDQAIDVILLQRKVPDTKAKIAGALARRDAWLAQHVDEAVLVWD